jgi:hypothetical protein
MAAAVAGTVGGLYIVLTQDTGAKAHDDHVGHSINHDMSDDEAPDGTNPDAPSVPADDDANTEDANKAEDEKDEDEKSKGLHELAPSESPEKAADDKKKEKKAAKEDTQEEADDEADPSPDKSDKVSKTACLDEYHMLTTTGRPPQGTQELQRHVRQAAGHVQRRHPPHLADLQARREVQEGRGRC